MKMKLFKHILSIFAILACSAAFAQQDVPGGATSVGEGENLGAGVASSQKASDMSVEAATDKDAKPIEINATDNHDIVHLAVKVNMDKASEITDDMIIQHLTTALRGIIGHAGDLSPFYQSAIAAVKTAVSNVAESGTVSSTVDLNLNIPNTRSGHAFPDNTIVTSGS